MLSQEIINSIASVIKIDAKTLSEAISAESEVNIEIPTLLVFTSEDLDKRDANIKKDSYDSGKVAGVEILVKELKEEYGVDVEGKDARKFMEAYKAKALKDANIDPEKKSAETDLVISGLKTRNAELENEVAGLRGEMKASDIRTKAFASVAKEYTLPKEKILHLMASDGYELTEEDGAIVFKQHGNIVRDAKTLNPDSVDKVFDSYAATNKLVKEEPPQRKGRGEGNSKRSLSDPTTLSELQKQWEAEGKSVNGAAFSARAMELAKDNPNFFDE